MIGHNNNHDRDVFQIASGEALARPAWRFAPPGQPALESASTRIQRDCAAPGSGPRPTHVRRQESAARPFAHLPVAGEVPVEWEPRSSLYNTDGQIFSDLGIPVVLFMENYDINRTGYHDTDDTMKNIDLDYASALAAIAIESVAATACEERAGC